MGSLVTFCASLTKELPGAQLGVVPGRHGPEHADIARLNEAGVGRDFYVVGNADEITSSA